MRINAVKVGSLLNALKVRLLILRKKISGKCWKIYIYGSEMKKPLILKSGAFVLYRLKRESRRSFSGRCLKFSVCSAGSVVG